MAYSMDDKVVVITGAATGIGSKVVRLALDEGAKHVAILDIAEEAGIALQDELNSRYGKNKVSFTKCDVSNNQLFLGAIDKIKNEHGYIDVFVNNAGILNDNLKMYAKQIDINVTALVTGSLKALELMRQDEGGKGGVVVNISSVAALCTVADTPIYSATKAAVLKFSAAMGTDLYYSRTGVRFLSVCFGATATPLLSKEKMGSFDPKIEAGISEALSTLKWQSPDSAARGVIDVYKNGASGSVWIVAGDKPAVDVTDLYAKSFEAFERLTALVTGSLKALELMRQDEGGKGGVVINISSVVALCTLVETPIYSATKAAVLKFSAAMGTDLYYSRTGVRFLSVCFGATATPLLTKEKMGSFDPIIAAGITEALNTLKKQSPDSAARDFIDVYKNGASGSVWIVADDKPAVDVTDLYTKSFEAFERLVYN